MNRYLRHTIGGVGVLGGATLLAGITWFWLLIKDPQRYEEMILTSRLPVGSGPFLLMGTSAAGLLGVGLLLWSSSVLLPRAPKWVEHAGMLMILSVAAMGGLVFLSFVLVK